MKFSDATIIKAISIAIGFAVGILLYDLIVDKNTDYPRLLIIAVIAGLAYMFFSTFLKRGTS